MSSLTADPIDPGALVRAVTGPGFGAIVLFVGTVRDHSDTRVVTAIDYEAHEALAGRTLIEVREEAEQRWPGARAVIVHRTGLLKVGEASVGIAVGAAHRVEAFEAARWVIDTLKERVPIWKKELGPEGEAWLHGSERLPAAADSEAER